MLNIEIDEENGIAILSPDSKLSDEDFKSATNIIDPYIERSGKLSGLIISTESFPGWESFSGLLSHLSFVKDHHKKIKHVAFVTNSPIGSLAGKVASHFVSAKIRTFKFSELELAKAWIISSNDAQEST
ncbi:STAS/SEC14 domain-containing protein [Marinobacterium sedimentorum]|uniref:STAS/SEC14 domain-containing protein n=1 Tax=Marinobacterium sedimentorum TaxID=2927804 RepID=UPI0020C6DCBD|nr:STAS/SEC14 domain-containing protein [Marinobacterium sedimentorum]MCP8690478.1 STAS/SEC14 domain-containing protein [Marinobacterium sedimentorum]